MEKSMTEVASKLLNASVTKLAQDAINDIVAQVVETIETEALKPLPKSEQRCPVLLPMGVLQGYEGEGVCGLRMTIKIEVEPLTGKGGDDE